MIFTVKRGESSVSGGPTPAPTITVQEDPVSGCTICPDGSQVLYPEATDEEGSTCEQLEIRAASLNDMTDCKMLWDAAQPLCGCKNYCTTMCPDGTTGPSRTHEENIVFIKNNRQVTCTDFQLDISSSYSNSMDECTSANFLGESVCGCAEMGAFCNMCHGGLDPPVDEISKEIVPGVSCRDLSGIAYCLRQDDPTGIFARLCPVFLAVGEYCGCGESPEQFCRICGDETMLPEPARLVYSTVLGLRTTCFHVKFASNMNDSSTQECDAYRQDGALECCA